MARNKEIDIFVLSAVFVDGGYQTSFVKGVSVVLCDGST
jgi:hypothetical protein